MRLKDEENLKSKKNKKQTKFHKIAIPEIMDDIKNENYET